MAGNAKSHAGFNKMPKQKAKYLFNKIKYLWKSICYEMLMRGQIDKMAVNRIFCA